MTEQKVDSLTWEYHESTIPSLSSATLPEHGASVSRLLGIGTLAGASFLSTLGLEAAQPPEPPAIVRNVGVEQSAEVKEIRGPADVLKVFSPDVHVYITRNPDTRELPVPDTQLKELAEHLAHSGNYLVIVGKAAGFEYTTPGGERLVGKEAVYRLLGQKVFDLPAFRQITDDRISPTTKSASLFILTCDPGPNNKDRDWFMSASSLHERFNITDEKDWKGGASYGKIAVPYFQRRQFSDGIVATVTRIDQDLNAAIRTELSRAEQQLSSATVAITGAREQFTEYQNRLADLNKRFPDRAGDLLHPGDLLELQTRLERGSKALEGKEFQTATEIAGAIKAVTGDRLKLLVEYPGAASRLESFSQELAQLDQHEFAFTAKGKFTTAHGLIDEALTHWQRGESTYLSSLTNTQQGIADLKASLADSLRSYNLDGEKISELKAQVDQLARSSQASVASSELASAREKIDRVHSEWQEKGPAYPEMLRDAEGEIGKTSLTISAAESAAARSKTLWNMFYGFSALLSAAAAVGGWLVNRRVQERKEEASKLLESLQQGMKKKEEGLEALERLKGRALASNGGNPASFPDGSRSATLAREACEALEKLWLFQVVANEEITTQAAASIAAGGILSSDNYDRAIEIMTKHPVEFSESNRERIKHAFSEQRSVVASLTVPIEELATFRKSMKEVENEFIRLAEVATRNFETIESARASLSESLDRVTSDIQSLLTSVETLEEYARTDSQRNILTAPEVRERLIPLLQEKVAQFTSEQTTDPVRTHERLALVSSQIAPLREILATLVEERSSSLREIRAIENTLLTAGLKPGWISDEIASISESVGTFVTVVSESVRNGTETRYESNPPDIRQLVETLETRSHEAVELESRRSTEVIASIETSETRVQTTREEIAKALSLKPNQVLTENNANPDAPLKDARALELDIRAALSEGELDRAEARISESLEKVGLAKEIVDATQLSFDRFSDRLKSLANAEKKIADSLPVQTDQLKQLKSRFKEAALEFFAGDLAREHADDTVANNISEIEESLKTATEAIHNAKDLRQQGKILQSADELVRAGESYMFCGHRLAEIEAKYQSLNALFVENQQLQQQARATHRELAGIIESDARITEATRAELEEVSTSILDSIDKLSEKEKTNPLEIQRQLKLADEALQAVRHSIGEDQSDHEQATNQIDKLQSVVSHALALVQKTEQNEIPDSQATDDAQHRVEKLSKDFHSLNKEFSEAERADWSDFSLRATKIHGKLNEAIDTIEREDSAGVEALNFLGKSKKHISQVSRWSGSHGVTISGSPGKNLLEQAMEAFGNADYSESLRLAKKAFSTASSALERAESEVANISARIAREQEEARQARAAARRRQEEANRRSSDYSYGGSTSSWSSSSTSSSGGSIFGGSDSSGGSSLGGFFDSSSSGGTSLGGGDGAGW